MNPAKQSLLKKLYIIG